MRNSESNTTEFIVEGAATARALASTMSKDPIGIVTLKKAADFAVVVRRCICGAPVQPDGELPCGH